MSKILRFRNRLAQAMIWCIGLIVMKSKAKPPIGYLELIRHSGIIDSKNPERDYQAVRKWEYADRLWIEGSYLKSVELRKSVLCELYKINGVLENGYTPPGISHGYVGPIGHQAILCTHIAAQNLGILDSRVAVLPIYKSQTSRPLIKAVEKHLSFLQYERGASWGELPNNWHIFERLQLIRTKDDFLDLYQLVEKVFHNRVIGPSNSMVELPSDYVHHAKFQLETLGLPNDAWFATIHIRNTGNYSARRNQPISSYFAAVREIIASGGWVVRVGDNSMDEFPKFKQFIDLAKSDQDHSYLHPYVLAKARFFVGTSSGPASVPPLFGVPTLITNTTSIGRNMLSSSANSIYIPKRTYNGKGKMLSYSEVMASPDGFGELEIKALQDHDLYLECNSEEEILLGVKELMARIEGSYVEDKKSLKTLEEIRTAFPHASRGTVAQSFIEKNKNWLN